MTFDYAHKLLADAVQHRGWLGEDPSDPSSVQAMQIALCIPKNDPPSRNDILVAAARAVVAACLKEDGDETYYDALKNWYAHRIRKVARRARNSGWDNVQKLAGVTEDHNGAQARAFQPSAVGAVDPLIRKLQISGTDLPHHDCEAPDPNIPVIYVDRSLNMSAGKTAAQVGHGSMLLAGSMSLERARQWRDQGYPLSVREIPRNEFAGFVDAPGAVTIRDAGYTEIAPGSVTVVALDCA